MVMGCEVRRDDPTRLHCQEPRSKAFAVGCSLARRPLSCRTSIRRLLLDPYPSPTRSDTMETALNRRALLGLSGRAMAASWLAVHASRAGFATEGSERTIDDWVVQLDAISKQLSNRKITALQWQEQVDRIFDKVPMRSLLEMIDFRKLADRLSALDLSERGEIFEDIGIGPIAKTTSEADSTSAIVKVAHIKKGRSIPPHGHRSMTSAFLCISGEFDVRLYDRLDDVDQAMIVRQTVHQKKAAPGSWSSISDYRDNVHWLTAKSDDCFLFTCKLIRLEPDREFRGRENINLKDAKLLGTDTWRAPIISAKQSAELY